MERRNEATTKMMRQSKWQYSQVGSPAPKILQLPCRHNARRNASKGKTTSFSSSQKDRGVKLEILFDQERLFDREKSPVNDTAEVWRRRKVADGREIGELSSPVDEAKWRFQAEMLRSECNLLRIEKEIALKKIERRKKRMERTLKSAVHTLLSGKQRISEGNKESKVLEDEITYLINKMNILKSPKVKDMEATNFRHNFDRQATVLRRELNNFDEDVSKELNGIQKMAEASFLINPNRNIETLSSKIEAMSKGVLFEKIEKEYGSKSIDLQDESFHDTYNQTIKTHEEQKGCSKHCKAVMKKIADEVRSEAEQWSQMQEMLSKVRNEMEELQSCRDFWQNRALNSDDQIQNLHSSVEGWRKKAISSEIKLKSLETEVCGLQEEISRLKKEPEKNKLPLELEKRVLICRLKENRHSNNEERTRKSVFSRPSLREIQNNSVGARHIN